MRGASQPEEAVHSIESMWSLGCQYSIRDQVLEERLVPVKVCPNFNSSGGLKALGVVVFVTVRVEASRGGSCDRNSSDVCTL